MTGNVRPVPSNITIKLTDLAGRATRVEKLPFLVGRRNADMLIEHASVSSQHASLDLFEGSIAVSDLGSTNGTKLNGFPVARNVAVKSGDELTFGNVSYTIEIIVAKAQAGAEPAAQDPNAMTQVVRAPKVLPIGEGRSVVLQVTHKGKQKQLLLEKRITSVGRVECDVTIDDPLMSRKHMQIEVYSDHFGLKDLASANGTFVEGKPISYLKVPSEVTFTCGSASFHLFFGDQLA